MGQKIEAVRKAGSGKDDHRKECGNGTSGENKESEAAGKGSVKLIKR